MNINYDEIITKANERKNALKEFESAVHHLNAVLDNEAVAYASALGLYKTACEKLDPEAHKMLPPDTAHVLNHWVSLMLAHQVYFPRASNGQKKSPQAALTELLGS